MVPKILTFGAVQNGKKIVFGSDFVTFGAPFYKWRRFTYGAVTHGKLIALLYLATRPKINLILPI